MVASFWGEVLMSRSTIVAVLAGALGLSLLTIPAGHAGRSPNSVLRWDMNEAPGSEVMLERSGRLNGMVGADVNTGRQVDGATNYGFPFAKPDTPPANPEHLVVVPHNKRMNPGRKRFKVIVRFRTKQNFGNLLQKGQARTAGGYWKFQMPSGKLQCLFRGGDRSVRTASSVTPLNDGEWHRVVCIRTKKKVKMKVDGELRSTRVGPTGRIRNTKPLTIAGKGDCNQVSVGCDYFTGGIDYVKIVKY
jgi:hypothetical protein